MKITELIADLLRCGVQLWDEDGQLVIRAPKGALTQNLRAEMIGRKAEILAFLANGTGKALFSSPLSYNQRSIWFLRQLAPESAAYNVAAAAYVRSEIDTAALRQTFHTLVNRHPSLRTTYRVVCGEPMQQIHERMEAHFEEVAAGTLDTQELREMIVDHYRRPFNLEQGPALRVSLFTRAANDHVLLITVHHIACDGSSLIILLNEFSSLYPSLKAGLSATLPPLKGQYADFVLRQREMLASPEAERQSQYWQRQLANRLGVMKLPLNRPRPPVQRFIGDSEVFSLSGQLTARLRRLAKDEGATLHMVLLAAFQTLLSRYSGQEDILVGSPAFGRNRAEFTNVVGHFVNLIANCANLSGDPTFRNLLRQVKHTVLAALEHQDYPFLALVERLHPKRSATQAPVVQVFFVFQKLLDVDDLPKFFNLNEMDATMNFGGLELKTFPLTQQEGQFDLKLEIGETDGEVLGATLQYNTDIFEANAASQMISHFLALLDQITKRPDEPISNLTFLTEAETSGYTAADFPEAAMSRQEFERLIMEIGRI